KPCQTSYEEENETACTFFILNGVEGPHVQPKRAASFESLRGVHPEHCRRTRNDPYYVLRITTIIHSQVV
ncbi:MAG: hypothetical protein JSV16_02360, partial [Candidatus Hydrogenedentota bacterium]